MNHDTDPPMSPQERAVADALAQLPALEPGPELDARIQAQARAALRAKPRARPGSRLRWLNAGLGSAAVAVLAAGIAWQAGLFTLDESTQRAPTTTTTFPKKTEPAASPRETGAPLAEPASSSATATPQSRDAAEVRDRRPANMALESRADAILDSKQSTRAPAVDAETRRQNQSHLRRTAAPARPAPSPIPDPKADQRRATTSATTDIATVNEAVVPADWRDDTTLAPDAWLNRIRTRLHHDDVQGARASLRAFVQDHPGFTVPDDLTGLLDQ